MSLIYEILKELSNKSFNYKGVKVDFLGLPKFKNYLPNTLSGTLIYMRKKGLLNCDNKILNIKYYS